MRSKNSRF